MHSLRDLQLRCRRAFLEGDIEALAGALPADASVPHVGIYRNNAKETFRQALKSSYPVVAELVGEECFSGLCTKYLETHPSRTPDLQEFGENFPQFLDQLYAISNHRYLVDVARLELAAEQVLLEPEMPPIDGQALVSVPGDALLSLRLVVSRSARLVASDYPILDICRMHHLDEAITVKLKSGPSRVVVARQAGDAVLRELSGEEFEMAGRLLRGETLGEVFEHVKECCNEAGFQTALAKLLNCRLFSNVTY